MLDKEKLLQDIVRHVQAGLLTEDELVKVYRATKPQDQETIPNPHADADINNALNAVQHPAQKENKINASDILYTIGAFIVYISINVFLAQAWDSIGSIGRVFFTLGLGFLFWFVAAKMITGKNKTEQSEGIGGAILFIGSLSVGAGVATTIAEFIDVSEVNAGLAVFGSLIAGSLHIGMDMIVKRTVTAVFGVLYGIAAYFAFVFWIFGETIENIDFWMLVSAFAGVLAIGGGSLLYKSDDSRVRVRTILWALGGFGILWSLYTLTFASDIKIVWQLVFPAVLYGAFIASIKSRSKNFLYSGAFFLFLYVVTMSFTYFGDGLGAAGALMFSGFGIIGSGVFVQNLKKKYFN